MWINTAQCIGLWVVRNIPKFKGRANRSRDTVQPMRRRAFVYQNIDPVVKNFQNSVRSRTNFKISLQYSSSYHIISKKRIRVLFIARNHWGVRTNSGPVAEVVAPALIWLARFLIEANWSCAKIIAAEVVAPALIWLARFLIEANWSCAKIIAVESVWKFVEILQNRNGTSY